VFRLWNLQAPSHKHRRGPNAARNFGFLALVGKGGPGGTDRIRWRSPAPDHSGANPLIATRPSGDLVLDILRDRHSASW
jgi:hypothetical protein